MAGTTLGQAIGALEEHLFVGRERELADFQEWLMQPSPAEILAVSGPGGVGKTALLTAFRRIARSIGRQVIDIDGQHLGRTSRGLLSALGGRSPDQVIRHLRQSQPLVLFDSFERSARLWPFLRDHLFWRMDANVRIAIASRQPLTYLWQRDDLWHKLVRTMPLDGLSRSESRVYLERRGLAGRPAVLDQILQATRGHPLAMSLAADLAVRLEGTSLESAPEWNLIVQSLVDRLRETEDGSVGELLECAAVVHDFDEATLGAIAGRSVDAAAFARLCGLSIVRPTAYGLTVHEDVRHLIAGDLRWRNVERFNELRDRAAAYCRAHGRARDPIERARALTNRFYLSEHSAVRTVLFADACAPALTVRALRPSQHAEIRNRWTDNAVAGLLSDPSTRLRVAHDTQEQIYGLAGVLPLSPDARLDYHDPTMESVVEAFLRHERESLADVRDTSPLFWHVHLIREGGEMAGTSTLAALLRESMMVFAEGGVHLTQASTADHQAALETLGFESLATPDASQRSTATAAIGYVLDLRHSGVDSWVDAVAAGRAPRVTAPQDIEYDLHAVLAHWQNDAWLNQSNLFAFAGVACNSSRPTAARVREIVRATVKQLTDRGDSDERLAARAVELAYLTPHFSHVAAMNELAVSRATFYRLIKRGVHALSQFLVAAEPV